MCLTDIKKISVVFLIFLAACGGGGDNTDPNLDSDLDGIPDISDELPFDTDNDGTNNDVDDDDDSDGVLDPNDAFPYDRTETMDSDSDGRGDNLDTDDDNDGVLDADDVFPLNKDESADTDGDTIGDNSDPDDDNDGIGDVHDGLPTDPNFAGDIDGDGIDTLTDDDDDGDGFSDALEIAEGSDPFDKSSRPLDSDGDGLTDAQELNLGTNPNTEDTDSDGVRDPVEISIGSKANNADTDSDFKTDGAEYGLDSDGDSIGDIFDFAHLISIGDPPTTCDPIVDRLGVAWNGTGDIVVARSDLNEIEVWSVYGEKRPSSFTGATLDKPNDVAVDASGNYYVVNTSLGNITKFGNDGSFIGTIGEFGVALGEFSFPRGIDVDTSGYLYIADTENNRIQVIGTDGRFAAAFGTFGQGDANFSSPVDVAVDRDGNIYVADRGNYRVQVFSKGFPLSFVRTMDYASLGFERATDFEPIGVTIAIDGTLYILNLYEPHIIAQPKNGSVRKFGAHGTGEGAFICPSGIAAGDMVVVSEVSRIQTF